MRRVKRAISCFLALVLVISNLPMNVLAEELSNEPMETIAVVNEAPTEPKETEMPTEFQETAAPLETAETAPEAIEETTETAEVTEDTIPVTEETLPEVTEEAIYTLTEQQRSLILSRDDGQWLFPLPQECYANITDWNGCRGESACFAVKSTAPALTLTMRTTSTVTGAWRFPSPPERRSMHLGTAWHTGWRIL